MEHLEYETTIHGFNELQDRAIDLGINTAIVASGMRQQQGAIALHRLKTDIITERGTCKQFNGVLLGVCLDGCSPEVVTAVENLIEAITRAQEPDPDPVVLWDPEGGAVTDSQLVQIVEEACRCDEERRNGEGREN